MTGQFVSIVTPAHILADAKDLAKDMASPARQRTVISRAYYAAYHAALAQNEFWHDKNQPGGLHRQFIKQLRRSPDPKMKAVGDRLEGLYGRRILADYQLGGMLTRQMASDAIEDAEEIVYDLLGFEVIATGTDVSK